MQRALLLGTSGCHLCELAEQIINDHLRSNQAWLIDIIDIAEQEQWQAQFALLIPVLYHPESQKQLGWPFDLQQVTLFFNELSPRK
jgi:Glutaredoxin-like domain (DUF836)